MARPRQKKDCGCVGKINALLLPRHRVLSTVLDLGRNAQRVILETHRHKDAKRSKAVALVATHCPFCGKKYESPPGAWSPMLSVR